MLTLALHVVGIQADFQALLLNLSIIREIQMSLGKSGADDRGFPRYITAKRRLIYLIRGLLAVIGMGSVYHFFGKTRKTFGNP
jgi:hypothetical protein